MNRQRPADPYGWFEDGERERFAMATATEDYSQPTAASRSWTQPLHPRRSHREGGEFPRRATFHREDRLAKRRPLR